MVQMNDKSPRSSAVLALPKRTSALIAYAAGVVNRMKGNPAFPNPTLPLAMVSAAIDDLRDAEKAAMTRTIGAATARDTRRGALVAMLQLLRLYVQSVADQSRDRAPAVIQSAGMMVKKPAARPRRAFGARRGAVPGTVRIVAPTAADRASYDWQYSTDGATWLDLPSTLRATTTMKHPSPGTTLHVRYRALTRAGHTAWSSPVTLPVS